MTKVKALVIVHKLLPSSFTYAKILTFNPYATNISFTCMAMATLEIFVVSNKPIITWPSPQLWFKKWTIKTKVFTPLDIHKSKLTMQVSQASRALEMIFFLFSHFNSMSFINWCFDGKETQGFYLKINLLRNGASTKDKGTNSLTMNKTKISSNWIWWGSFLL